MSQWPTADDPTDSARTEELTIRVLQLIMACAHRMGHTALTAVVCPSVRSAPDPKSRMEGRSKLKFGRKEAHDTDDP